MDIQHLRSFKTIVEKGNFQDAASELNYSLSAISYQMQQLENEVKFPLFEKIGRRMVATEQSLKLIPHIKKIEDQIGQIRLLNSKSKKIEGSLTISVSDSILTYIIQPVLKEFIKKAPDVTLKLKVKNRYDIQKEVIRNEIDLGIHYQAFEYDKQIIVNEIKDFSIGIIASPDMAISERDFDTSNQTKNISIINNDPNAIYQIYFGEHLREKEIKLTGQTLEVWSIESTKQSVISNLGIACLPLFVVKNELNEGKVNEIPIKDFKRKITMITAQHSNKWISPAMELFLHLLKEQHLQ
ncbi:LysR family transcriptional regulator [Sphingobacterium tabacisoli]|uniref:LysR family transcriptional regulator n=1 Tax=Sphingobacterium tabacisoli TaxID=2044855 RepID=A0ABW5L685_9SPHI|nr:LysR family transcriptional regulator [Sphingobacterium tabacisoli]